MITPKTVKKYKLLVISVCVCVCVCVCVSKLNDMTKFIALKIAI